jgi:lipid-binding SYLF domain-containing protein
MEPRKRMLLRGGGFNEVYHPLIVDPTSKAGGKLWVTVKKRDIHCFPITPFGFLLAGTVGSGGLLARIACTICVTWDALCGIAMSSNLSIQPTISCSSAGVRVWSFVWASERVFRPFRRAWTVLRGTPCLAAARRIERREFVLCTSSIASRMRISLVSFARALTLGIGSGWVVVVLPSGVFAPLFMPRNHQQPPSW